MGGQSIPDSGCGLRADGIARVCAATGSPTVSAWNHISLVCLFGVRPAWNDLRLARLF